VAAGADYDGLNYDVVLARFEANGALDTSFGTGGGIGTDFHTEADDIANAVLVQPDGAIVIAGFVGHANVLLARYAATGCSTTTTAVQTSSTTTTTTPPPACVQLAGRNRLVMSRRPGSSDRLVWKWTRSLDAIDLDDIVDPARSTLDYDLQLFDGTFGGREVTHWPYFSAVSCTPDACWKPTKNGFRFTSSLLGVTVNLRTGPVGKGQVRIRWRRPSLIPTLPLTPPVELRFLRADGRTCFVSRFAGESIRKNDGLTFDGR
jgi:hypothetical protein